MRSLYLTENDKQLGRYGARLLHLRLVPAPGRMLARVLC